MLRWITLSFAFLWAACATTTVQQEKTPHGRSSEYQRVSACAQKGLDATAQNRAFAEANRKLKEKRAAEKEVGQKGDVYMSHSKGVEGDVGIRSSTHVYTQSTTLTSTSWLNSYEIGGVDAQGRYLLESNTVPAGIQVFLVVKANGAFAHVVGCSEEVQFPLDKVTENVPENQRVWRIPVVVLENLFRGKNDSSDRFHLYLIRKKGEEARVAVYFDGGPR